MTRVKICGLTRAEDARSAAAAGVEYGGVILAPGSPRTVHPEAATGIFAETTLVRCGVFVDETLSGIVEAVRVAGLSVVQLHGDESPDFAAEVRSETGLEVWKAVRPRSGEEFSAAVRHYAAWVDGLLLDGWSAEARGGTGTRFPWEEVAQRRGALGEETRLIVAGGLHPANVGTIIGLLRPDVVDVSSGVECAPGIKDAHRVQEFADAARAPAQQGVR